MNAIVSKLEPKSARSVGNRGGGNLPRRVGELERRMTAVEALAGTAATKAGEAATAAQTAADNTDQLLAISNAAKGIVGFAKKHGPRIVAFVTGILATAGVGNPKVLSFVHTFFS